MVGLQRRVLLCQWHEVGRFNTLDDYVVFDVFTHRTVIRFREEFDVMKYVFGILS